MIEKCFDHCDGKIKEKMIKEILKKENISDLLLDEHGNYIIQKVLSISEINVKKFMLKIIVGMFGKLKNVGFGERIINRINANYKDFINEFIKNEENFNNNNNSFNNSNNEHINKNKNNYYNNIKFSNNIVNNSKINNINNDNVNYKND